MAKNVFVMVTNDLNQDQRMQKICTSIHQLGHHVVLIGRKKKDSLSLLEMPFHQERLNLWFQSGVLFYLEYNIRLIFLLLKRKPDIIYSVDLDTLLAGGILKMIRGKKLIFDAHEFYTEVPELNASPLKKNIWSALGKFFIPKADLRFTVNQSLAQILGEKYHDYFHVIRNVPVYQATEQVKERSDIPIIIYQGVLNMGRGLEAMIETVNTLDYEVVFQVVGEGDLSDSLRQKASELKNAHRIVFLGWKSPDQLRQLTKIADIGINVLDSNSLNYKFSLANKFFDYMHAGVPSINMDFPEYRQIVDQHQVGICIPDIRTETLRLAIDNLLLDSVKYRSLSQNAFEAASAFNWQKEEVKLKTAFAEKFSD